MYNEYIGRCILVNRIAELRKKLGLTQTRLGEEIGVSQQTMVLCQDLVQVKMRKFSPF